MLSVPTPARSLCSTETLPGYATIQGAPAGHTSQGRVRRHHVDRGKRERRQWMLTEVTLALGFLAVLALILVIIVRLLTMP